jgi:hypothetical protein
MKPFGGTVTSTNKRQSESREVRFIVTERMKRQTSNKYVLQIILSGFVRSLTNHEWVNTRIFLILPTF